MPIEDAGRYNSFYTLFLLSLKKKPAIPCLGSWSHAVDGSEYNCEYKYAGKFGCEDCLVNGGDKDPRTGKSYRRHRIMRRLGARR